MDHVYQAQMEALTREELEESPLKDDNGRTIGSAWHHACPEYMVGDSRFENGSVITVYLDGCEYGGSPPDTIQIEGVSFARVHLAFDHYCEVDCPFSDAPIPEGEACPACFGTPEDGHGTTHLGTLGTAVYVEIPEDE